MARRSTRTEADVSGLIGDLVVEVKARREKLLASLAQLDGILAAVGGNGAVRRRIGRGRAHPIRGLSAGKPAGRGRRGRGRGGPRGVRLPKKGTIGGRVLVALGKGPTSSAHL